MSDALALPSPYGSFTCVGGIMLEPPTRTMFPRVDIGAARGVYFCQDFRAKILPNLANKHAMKPPKEGESQTSSLTLHFWRSSKQLRVPDVEKNFPGKQKPVPWWGLLEFFKRQHYGTLELPFSLNGPGLICFMPYLVSEKTEGVALIHSSVQAGSLRPEWWVHLFEQEGKPPCSEEIIYVSALA